jgi:hypothetical protein
VREPCVCGTQLYWCVGSEQCASGRGLSVVLLSCAHGDELVVSIKDEKCLEHVSGH